MSKFKKQFSSKEREQECTKIRQKYPDRIPIIVEPYSNKIDLIDKKKFLVPNEITIGQFLYIVRKRIKLNEAKALFLFINSTLPNSNAIISSIYEKEKDPDGFLYITYSGENTYGS